MDFYDLLLAKKLNGGGGGEAVLINKNISANGTYNASSDSADGYKKVVVSVPNTYSAGDEGKVVSSGALVSQSSATYTSNNTYDTTLINSVTVNVPQGWTSDGIANGTEPSGSITLTGNTIKWGAFAYTTALTSVTTSAKWIDAYAFHHSSITSVLASNWEGDENESDAFSYTKLTKITDDEFPNLTNLNKSNTTYVFQYCEDVTKIFLSKLRQIGKGVFRRQTSLQTVVLPALDGYVAGNVFEYDSNLEAVDIKNGTISSNVFLGCSKLNKMIMRGSSVTTLQNTNNFSGTPFASNGTGGTFYVPSSLISSYQSASNWSTILGYANNQIKSIESTHTDPTAPIDLTLYYADGTPIS